jgi:hypothetical protein
VETGPKAIDWRPAFAMRTSMWEMLCEGRVVIAAEVDVAEEGSRVSTMSLAVEWCWSDLRDSEAQRVVAMTIWFGRER